LILLSRYDEAIREITIALDLDPLARIMYAGSIWIHSAVGDEKKVSELFGRVRELDPDWAGAFSVIANAYDYFGHKQKSNDAQVTFLEMSAATDQERDDARRLRDAVNRGEEAFAREQLRQHQRQRRETCLVPVVIANAFAELGEVDSTIAWLEKGFDERSVFMLVAVTNPRFDPMRSDPRFQNIVRRMGLEDAQARYLKRRDRRAS
jgi:predicted Zn-dependent protease